RTDLGGAAFAVAPLVTVPWCRLAGQLSSQVGFCICRAGLPAPIVRKQVSDEPVSPGPRQARRRAHAVRPLRDPTRHHRDPLLLLRPVLPLSSLSLGDDRPPG